MLFASMCVIWGIPYLLIKVAVSDLSPATLVLARTGIAALLLLPIAAARSELRPVLRHWVPVLAFASIEIAIPWMLLGVAEQHISSSLTGLLIAAVPLVGALIARTTGARERMGVQSGIGLILGLIGVAAIVGVNPEGSGAVPLLALAVVTICYAIGPVILQRYLAGVPALGVLAAALGVTALAYIPIAAFSLPDEMPRATVVGSVVALAVVCTAVAFDARWATLRARRGGRRLEARRSWQPSRAPTTGGCSCESGTANRRSDAVRRARRPGPAARSPARYRAGRVRPAPRSRSDRSCRPAVPAPAP